MTSNIEDLTKKTDNLKIDLKWNELLPEVKLEYLKAIEEEKSSFVSDNTVKLNIGGTVFQTTKSTLTKYNGFFKTVLETDVPVTKDSSGAIFIDRDSTHFRSIFNFMRDGEVELPESVKDVKEIQKESQYYLLLDLVEQCNAKLKKLLSTWSALASELENEKISINVTVDRVEIQLCEATKLADTYNLPCPNYDPNDGDRCIQAFADIMKNNEIDSINIEVNTRLPFLTKLESLVPDQSLTLNSMNIWPYNGNFENEISFLKMSCNKIERIYLHCWFEKIPIDELMSIPAFIKATYLFIRAPDPEQLVPIFEKFVASDPKLGQRLSLLTGTKDSVMDFKQRLQHRACYKNGAWTAIRCSDPAVVVKYKIEHVNGWPIYCEVGEFRH